MAPPYAGVLGLTAFATMAIRGLTHGDGSSVLFPAWLALIVFSIVGYIVGGIAEWTVRQSVAQRISRELESRREEDSKRTNKTKAVA